MPLLPEKLSSRGEVRGSIASQFWDQPAQSAKSLEGLVRTLPCEPPPLQQCGHSGLSRAQQLVAAQALDVPFFPSYVASEGGLVSSLACKISYLHPNVGLTYSIAERGRFISSCTSHFHISPCHGITKSQLLLNAGARPSLCSHRRKELVEHSVRQSSATAHAQAP